MKKAGQSAAVLRKSSKIEARRTEGHCKNGKARQRSGTIQVTTRHAFYTVVTKWRCELGNEKFQRRRAFDSIGFSFCHGWRAVHGGPELSCSRHLWAVWPFSCLCHTCGRYASTFFCWPGFMP